MARDPKSDVLQISLSRYHSLDLVRLPKSRRYRIVFAERFGVQRRAFIEISFDEAHKVALFLASVDDQMRDQNDDDPPTDPSRPSALPPPEVSEILKDFIEHEEFLERDAVPQAIPRGTLLDPNLAEADTVLAPEPRTKTPPPLPPPPMSQRVRTRPRLVVDDTVSNATEGYRDDPRTGVVPVIYDKPPKDDA